MKIPGFEHYSSIIPIEKGWSGDKKYCVTDAHCIKYLLRISPIARYAARKSLFEILRQVSALGIPMCRPVAFGTCPDGVYTLHSWVDGVDLEDILPTLTAAAQYDFGMESGKILQGIHALPAPDTQEDWETRFNRKIDGKIKAHRACPIQFDGSERMIDYISANRHLLRGRPQCFQHGDYHVGNMMLLGDELVIIDFDRYDFGDPWEEFNRIVWCAQAAPPFATGMIDSYFGGPPPEEFWRLLALYISSNTLSSVPWAIPFGQTDVDVMLNQAKDVLSWYNNMQTFLPAWYCGIGM
ncbi:phosphotransferase [Ruminococcaceae bacterium OttesenSCG-928-D13]|nr:phosphotransferase [Ruminococcaceae bacterium OttesenSCG-928-D13]